MPRTNLVEDYISSGKAISSERLLGKIGLNCSAATIRKDLNNLESQGLIAELDNEILNNLKLKK